MENIKLPSKKQQKYLVPSLSFEIVYAFITCIHSLHLHVKKNTFLYLNIKIALNILKTEMKDCKV